MRFTLIFLMLSLLLVACRTADSKIHSQIVGTWTKDIPINPATFSWTDPVSFTFTFSSDGSFSESLGHRSEPVTYQGTWLLRGSALILTITNAQGTGSHKPSLSEIGKVKSWKIAKLDEHQLIYTAGGHTNLFTR